MHRELYDILGVPVDADAGAIKRAHRRRAKVLHPDVGGDAEAFAAVQLAYDTLSDPAARETYDRTGQVPGADNEDAALLDAVAQIVVQVLGQALATNARMASIDFVESCRQVVRHRLRDIGQAMDAAQRQAKALDEITARVTVRRQPADGPPGNRLRALVEGQAQETRRRLASLQESRAFSERLLAFLDGYAFERDPAATALATAHATVTFTLTT